MCYEFNSFYGCGHDRSRQWYRPTSKYQGCLCKVMVRLPSLPGICPDCDRHVRQARGFDVDSDSLTPENRASRQKWRDFVNAEVRRHDQRRQELAQEARAASRHSKAPDFSLVDPLSERANHPGETIIEHTVVEVVDAAKAGEEMKRAQLANEYGIQGRGWTGEGDENWLILSAGLFRLTPPSSPTLPRAPRSPSPPDSIHMKAMKPSIDLNEIMGYGSTESSDSGEDSNSLATSLRSRFFANRRKALSILEEGPDKKQGAYTPFRTGIRPPAFNYIASRPTVSAPIRQPTTAPAIKEGQVTSAMAPSRRVTPSGPSILHQMLLEPSEDIISQSYTPLNYRKRQDSTTSAMPPPPRPTARNNPKPIAAPSFSRFTINTVSAPTARSSRVSQLAGMSSGRDSRSRRLSTASVNTKSASTNLSQANYSTAIEIPNPYAALRKGSTSSAAARKVSLASELLSQSSLPLTSSNLQELNNLSTQSPRPGTGMTARTALQSENEHTNGGGRLGGGGGGGGGAKNPYAGITVPKPRAVVLPAAKDDDMAPGPIQRRAFSSQNSKILPMEKKGILE